MKKKFRKTIKFEGYLYSDNETPLKVVWNTGSIRIIADEDRGIKPTVAFPFGTRNPNDQASSMQGALMKALDEAGIKMVHTGEEMDYEVRKFIAEQNYIKAKKERDKILSEKPNI